MIAEQRLTSCLSWGTFGVVEEANYKKINKVYENKIIGKNCGLYDLYTYIC